VIEGSLDRLHLGDLLQWLQMGALTGRLTLIERHRRRHLDFLDGRLVFASSSVPEERLATWLARENLLPVPVLRRLLALSLLRRTLFTALLIDRGGLEPERLHRSLTELAETIASKVLAADHVRFTLDPSYPVRDLHGVRLHIEPNLLLMEAARRTDEKESMVTPSLESPPLADDEFLWSLIREGIPSEERVDGEEIAHLQKQLREITAKLRRWLDDGPGLVPVPTDHLSWIETAVRAPVAPELEGLTQLVWNQMVLACAVRGPVDDHPHTLHELRRHAMDLDVWRDMATAGALRRQATARIDDLTSRTAQVWSKGAAAAAPHVGVPVDSARLAAHLVVVPTDLVLWLLTTVPIPHKKLRSTIVRALPRRLGRSLALLGNFPEPFQSLFTQDSVTALGVCLHLARQILPSPQLWPLTVPEDESALFESLSPGVLTAAATAARRAAAPSLEVS
jgi:hypothetical protein